MDDAIYYRHAGSIPLAQRVSYRARMAVYEAFIREMGPTPDTTVLDVGVSLDCSSPESNMLEQHYPYRGRITCAGIGDGTEVVAAYPGVTFREVAPHAPLPFPDKHFDIVYSNAVVEHVGSRERQRAFVADLCRVGRAVFMVAPNRLFPIEHHTGIPLVHWLPLPAFRGLMARTPLRHWAEEENLNPVLASDVAALFPAGIRPAVSYAGLGIGPFKSNLVAVARTTGA